MTLILFKENLNPNLKRRKFWKISSQLHLKWNKSRMERRSICNRWRPICDGVRALHLQWTSNSFADKLGKRGSVSSGVFLSFLLFSVLVCGWGLLVWVPLFLCFVALFWVLALILLLLFVWRCLWLSLARLLPFLLALLSVGRLGRACFWSVVGFLWILVFQWRPWRLHPDQSMLCFLVSWWACFLIGSSLCEVFVSCYLAQAWCLCLILFVVFCCVLFLGLLWINWC